MQIRKNKQKSKPKEFTLREFWERRNQILIIRRNHAIGDLFIHRMIFEDIKKLDPEIQINFACHPVLIDTVKDHPYVDRVLDYQFVKEEDYIAHYNNSTVCQDYESSIGINNSIHRSDIWANNCGVVLQSHNMHINISTEAKTWASEIIAKLKSENMPIVLLCPYSPNVGKNLLDEQISVLVNYLKEKKCVVFSIHTDQSTILNQLNVPVLTSLAFQNLVALVDAADYVISIDTAFYHIAGGLGKPLLGIFSYINGKIYGKYYQSELIQKHRDNGDWDCGPCGYHFNRCPKSKKGIAYACMYEITTEMLKNGVDKMFERWPNDKSN